MTASQRRRSIRLPAFNYTSPGAYFVTICTFKRACVLGDVVGGNVRLGILGQTVAEIWKAIPEHLPSADTDAFVIMPNHVHGILQLRDAGVGAKHASPLRNLPKGTVVGSLPAIVQTFKSSATREANRRRGIQGGSLWQRGYYEHVIRGEEELARIRGYIEENPARWEEDEYFEGDA